MLGQEAWPAAHPPRGVVEDGAAAEGDARDEPVSVLCQPDLLERHPEADQQDVGGCGIDLLEYRLVLGTPCRMVEVAVMDADDPQAGITFPQPPRGLLRDAGSGAEEVEREVLG